MISYKSKEKEEIIDDGSSNDISIWRINEFEKVKYPKEMYGRFFSSDCYIILYKYQKKNKFCYVVYFWQGLDSSKNDKGSSALLSVNLAENLQEENVQIRILQHQETNHFLSMFKIFIIHFGKFSDYQKDSNEVFEIRESNTGAIRAIGFQNQEIHVHSNTIFLFKTKKTIFANVGMNSTTKELDYTKNVSSIISEHQLIISDDLKDISLIFKNQCKIDHVEVVNRNQIKLFHFFAQSGVVEFTEIFDFSQSNLNEQDVYILENGETIYCWFGEKSTFYCRKFTLELAEKYQKKLDAKNLFVIKSTAEPIEFSILFQSWISNSKSKLEKKCLNSKKILDEYQRTTYSYHQLLSDDQLPEGIDPTKLEVKTKILQFI